MGEVKTLVTLVLGGMFDHNELGDIDIIYESPAAEALQQELVTGVDDVHVELVSRLDYDALMQRNFELLAENESLRKDAERYRLARDGRSKGDVDICIIKNDWRTANTVILCDEIADHTIDAAIEKERT